MAHVVIIGAGMSGMSLAWYLKALREDWRISVIEAHGRAGGKAWTETRDGFVIERGVNGVLDNKPFTLELAKELGLSPLRSRDAARKRFIVRSGRLMDLPDSPRSFLSSGCLSPAGKLRLLAEPFIPQGDLEKDESLEDFAVRRLGREAYQYLIDPMASGVHAGNPQRLSLKSCFPRIHELERDYGSLIRAMLKLQAEARKKRRKGPSAGPGGVLTSFRNGISELADRLACALGDSLVLGCPVEEVEFRDGSWHIGLENGECMEDVSHVVVACPAHAAARLFRSSIPELAKPCASIEYPPIAVVAFGISANSVSSDLNGFGFLAPFVGKRGVLGALWDSSVFDNRAPAGYHLVRCLIGGMRNRHCLEQTDSSLKDIAYRELKSLCGFNRPPEFSAVFRWKRAIPQYNVGHAALLERLKMVVDRLPGLFIRCNWAGGVSLNDCIMNSRRLAGQIASGEVISGF